MVLAPGVNSFSNSIRLKYLLIEAQMVAISSTSGVLQRLILGPIV